MIKKYHLLIYIILFCSCQKIEYINQKDFSIKNAIYIIRNREGNVNLEYNPEIKFMDTKINLKQNFELIQEKNKINNSDIFYFIKEKNRNILLSAEKNGDKLIVYSNELDINYALWNITPKINDDNKLIYYVQNKKTGCYWELTFSYSNYELKLRKKSDNSLLNKDNEFLFIELYKNVNMNNSELVEKEPIDVLIKYIDLKDEKLNRTGIKTIQKDYEKGEIKYCVRSILQNIPWIRKIYILMPNDEVKYFLPKEQINDKIIYVKDKDLLGFDSENNNAFLCNIYKMKQFGLSENFIYMDDDYFIARPINKSEMFYEEDGEIYPAIITTDFYELDKNFLSQKKEQLINKKYDNDPHSPSGFYIRQKNSQLFLYDIFGNDETRFGKKLIEPAFTHNAIPLKLSDIEELHQLIFERYEYGKLILYSKERSIQDLQFQTLYWDYVKNKYDRKVYKISSKFYELIKLGNILSSTERLFVINTSSRKYRPILFIREKQILEVLFPKKTKYELDEKKIKKKVITTQNNKYINEFFLEKIKEKINSDSLKNKVVLNTHDFLKKIKNYFKNDNVLKKILKEEIQYMKDQCHWQEMINFILVIFFMLLLIYRYSNNKNSSNEF